MVTELHIFKIQNNSLVFPVFYVEAKDILDATEIAKKIVESLNNDRVVGSVSVIDVPLLRWEE